MSVELFTEAPPAVAPSPRWRGCVVCGTKAAPRAAAGHDICVQCVAAPSLARARLATQRAALVNQQRAAARDAQAAWNALSEAERERWGVFALLRDRKHAGEALTPDERRKLDATHAAYAAPDHPAARAALEVGETLETIKAKFGAAALLAARIPPALRAYHGYEECLWWANEALEHGGRQIDLRLAQLEVCLEEMEARP